MSQATPEPPEDPRIPYGMPAAPDGDGRGTGSSTAASPGARPQSEGAAALQAALRSAVRVSVVVCLAAGALLALVAGLLVGLPGVWGAVIGVALALVFLATTAVVGSRVAGGDPMLLAVAILGSWLIKVIIFVAIIAALRRLDFYDPRALFAGVVVGLLLTLWAEYRALTAARVPHVEPTRRV